MIYNTNLLRKEFRNAYMQQQVSHQRQFSLGIFLGLLTFALYFSLQTLKESVLNDAAPYLLLPSYFSTLYIYLLVSLVFNVLYFISNYEYMTFIEVMRNRWYALVQLGYPSWRLIGSKIVVRIVSQTFIYSVGFIATIFLSSFLKFPLVLEYFFPMYLLGLIDVILLAVVSLSSSLFLRDIVNARYAVVILALVILTFKYLSGYFTILEDRTLMGDLSNMFTISRTIYMPVVGVMIITGFFLCMVRGKKLARVYTPPMLHSLPLLAHKLSGTVVLSCSGGNKKEKPFLEAQSTPTAMRKRPTFASVFTGLLLIVLISGLLLVNVVVLAFGYASPEKETSIYGVIPYIFQSSTMEPTIMYNDIAFFKKIDYQASLAVGDILLFKDLSGAVDVSSLKKVETDETTGSANGKLDVDVINYLDKRYTGALAQTINRNQVYGVYFANNRWFGAIILFANTTLGRLLMLLIPTFLIFFYSHIVSFFRNISEEKA